MEHRKISTVAKCQSVSYGPVARNVSPTGQTVQRTIIIVPKIQTAFLLTCCTKSKSDSTYDTPHNCYSFQHSECFPFDLLH